MRHLAWRVAASGLLIMVSIATLVYFRPAVIGMVVDHGAGRTPQALAEEAHRWVALNGSGLSPLRLPWQWVSERCFYRSR